MRAAELIAESAARLAAAGIESARLDALLLIAAALGCERDDLRVHGDRPIAPAERAIAESYMNRRLVGREPVSRILGRREFWGLEFGLSADTLDPRPDSETLVEAALALFPDKDMASRVLDLGTGSGCLLLSVLHERPAASGLGIDRSRRALTVAARNAARLGLSQRARFVAGHWAEAIGGIFDLVLCNPPYVARSERSALAPEVLLHDPPAALFAGEDGLDAYRELLPRLAPLLAESGRALFEIGATQAVSVRALAAASGLAVVAIKRDLGGRDRCAVLRSV